MDPCKTSMFVAALANSIACELSSPDEIAAVAAIFTQLGDTMATIATQQTLCNARKDKNSD